MKRYWHYTLAPKYEKIREDGFIKASTAYIKSYEKPAVWLSTNPDWEESVRGSITNEETGEEIEASRDEFIKYGFTPVRIEISPEPLMLCDWYEFKERSGIPTEIADMFEKKLARDWGYKISEWRVSFEPIHQKHFLTVEIWDGQNWAPIWNR